MEDNANRAHCLPELQSVLSLIATFCAKRNTEELTCAECCLIICGMDFEKAFTIFYEYQ